MAASMGSSEKVATSCRRMVCVSLFVAVLLLRSVEGSTCAQSAGNLRGFSCQAVNQRSDITKPSVILSWEWPPPTGNLSEGELSVEVVYEAGGIQCITGVAGSDNTTTVDLHTDNEYSFRVYLICENASRREVASCEVNTSSRRTIGRLSPSCPSALSISGSTHTARIQVSWLGPYNGGVNSVDTWKLCLYHGNTSLENAPYNPDVGGNFVMNFTELPGTVCLFGGKYLDKEYLHIDIPAESCGIPAIPSTGIAQLKLNCSESMAAVEVVTSGDGDVLNSTQLQGRCITPDWVPNESDEHHISSQLYLEAGNTSISNLPEGTICSFYGSYMLQSSDVEFTFEPTQCVVNEDVPHPETPLSHSCPLAATASPTTTTPPTSSAPPTTTAPPTSTASPTTTTPPTSTAPPTTIAPPTPTAPPTTTGPPTDISFTTDIASMSTASGFRVDGPIITAVVVMATLVITGLVCLITTCLIVKRYSLRRRREHKLKIWVDTISKRHEPEDLDEDPHVLPQLSYTSHILDTVSVTTEVDYLYKEEGRAVVSGNSLSSLMKAMESDDKVLDSPKLIMDRFLNGCHERVWECSDESLPRPCNPNSGKLTELQEHMELHLNRTSNLHLDKSQQHCSNNDTSDDDAVHCVIHSTSDNHSVCASSYVPSKDCFTDDEGYIHVHFRPETTV